MDPLPSSPPYIPSSTKQNKMSPFQFLPKQTKSSQRTPDSLLHNFKLRSREQPILRNHHRTNPAVWCAAILCMIFSILLIFFGIATLIVYAAIQPRTPVFDTPQATLTAIYFTNPEFIYHDVTFLANFSNPNRKLDVRFEYMFVELYFSGSLIGSQVLQPFRERPREARFMTVHLVSRLVHLPPNLALELQKQEQTNRVVYNIKGKFRVKVMMGLVHYSYWLHGECQLEMTSPPNSFLITHSCTNKR